MDEAVESNATSNESSSVYTHTHVNIASQHLRFLNYLIDHYIVTIVTVALSLIGIFLYAPTTNPFIDRITSLVVGVTILLVYYAVFEGIWGKTPAKFITKTAVRTKTGEKPSVEVVFVRSICRIIPFDMFSFLFSWYPVGWHDKFSGTVVIDERHNDRQNMSPLKNIGMLLVDYVVVNAFFLIVLVLVFLFLRPFIPASIKQQYQSNRQTTRQAENVSKPAITISDVSVSPKTSIKCPTQFTFFATITANEPMTIEYVWERSDNSISPGEQITVAKGERLQVHTSWFLNKSYEGWERLHILSPSNTQSPLINFSLRCY